MTEIVDPFNVSTAFDAGDGRTGQIYSLPRLQQSDIGDISTLPVSLRIILESVLRNCDGHKITEDHIRQLANWQPNAERTDEIPFVVARIVLQDFTGVPLLVDLAAMRSAVERMGKDPAIIEPLVPVDLVVDHSIQVDFAGWTEDALKRNMEIEFKRNRERYEFLKWGMQAFDGFGVVPSGIGIVHQVNLEYLAQCVLERDGVFLPDSLVGTDSHTTMINGLGVVGWGVGGIEAEAGMLGQPVYFLTPDVVGVEMHGSLREGVTATDLVLHVTELLRQTNVVGKFVEFHGEGASTLSVPDRATIGNMAPEYGATMGYFPPDEKTCDYLRLTGRSDEQVELVRRYFTAQGIFGIPAAGECRYTTVVRLDLADVEPGVAGPKRPQDRINLADLKDRFRQLFQADLADDGYGKSLVELDQKFGTQVGVVEGTIAGGGHQNDGATDNGEGHGNSKSAAQEGSAHTNKWTEEEMMNNRPTPDQVEPEVEQSPKVAAKIGHGDVVIAAITSCTNTSNPSVMLGAGLLAKNAVERGLTVSPIVKTSLAPGSRVVTEYLDKTGLQPYLDRLGFRLVGYGCTTCIGNSGPLDLDLEKTVIDHDLIAASVLSGNRNFEARVHQSVKANFLMSPPLVVAFALAGRVDIDLDHEPLGKDRDGCDVYLRDIWPSTDDVNEVMKTALEPEVFRRLYGSLADQNPLWNEIPSSTGNVYEWNSDSTYIQEPPFFIDFKPEPEPTTDVVGARALAIFGDSVTTDHISPAGAIKKTSPAGAYLREQGVEALDFNSYGSRRGNDRVMTRGTFANVRIKNLMVPGTEGGVTVHRNGTESEMSIYDAAQLYRKDGVPLLVFAGEGYGAGSSRDWAAKGTSLLGARAVIAQSFERIHRSNLVGMGVLPCEFPAGVTAQTLGLDGSETFDLAGIAGTSKPRQPVTLTIRRTDGSSDVVELLSRIDTPIEVEYFRHGGILPYVLRELAA